MEVEGKQLARHRKDQVAAVVHPLGSQISIYLPGALADPLRRKGAEGQRSSDWGVVEQRAMDVLPDGSREVPTPHPGATLHLR